MLTTIDREYFFNTVRTSPFSHMAQGQVDGCNHLLDVWEQRYSRNPLSYLAYALATTFHETAFTMKPIEEYGKGEGKLYGPTGFWGRGYVQLTWRSNYEKMSAVLKGAGIANVDLVANPDKALDPTIAADILYLGMLRGSFTGNKLSDFIPNNPVEARRIINGTDRAVIIAGYYNDFLKALRTESVSPNIPVASNQTSGPGFFSRIFNNIFSRRKA